MLDPARTCDGCEFVNGYPGEGILNRKQLNVKYQPLGKPPGQSEYPFIDVTSQQVYAVNNHCGPQSFYGENYDQGSCGPSNQRDLLRNWS